MDFLILLLLGFVLIWMLIVMPQRRRASAHRQLVEKISPGDEILTAGGLLGRVTRVDEDEVGLEVAKGVEVRVAKRAVAAVLPPEDAGTFPAT